MEDVISSKMHIQRLGRNVSILMEMSGETYRELADAVESAPTSIYQLVKAKNDPRVSLVLRLAEHYSVDIGDLLKPTKEFQEIVKKNRSIQIAS